MIGTNGWTIARIAVEMPRHRPFSEQLHGRRGGGHLRVERPPAIRHVGQTCPGRATVGLPTWSPTAGRLTQWASGAGTPGWGYTWIGAEPWGWLPYHYGGWDFIPGRGWVWFPGSLRTWSPSQVTWFHGPNWVGWIPRPHRKDGAIACGNNCGGGVVSTSTFRHGGLLTSNLMLGVNPTTGERVKRAGNYPHHGGQAAGAGGFTPRRAEPGLPGEPCAHSGWSEHSNHGHHLAGIATRRRATPNSAIVYDPQQDSYVNGHRVTTPQPIARPRQQGASALTTPAANPGLIQPVPVGSREASGRPVENQGLLQPNPAMGASPIRPVPVGPRMGSAQAHSHYAAPAIPAILLPSRAFRTNSDPRSASGRRPSGGSHVGGGGAPAGGHSGSAPAGGGHAGGAPAGGGGASGGHH